VAWQPRSCRAVIGWVDKMLKRRRAEAGITDLHPHAAFRHTWVHAFRAAGGYEGDLTLLGGWRSRAMWTSTTRRPQWTGRRRPPPPVVEPPHLCSRPPSPTRPSDSSGPKVPRVILDRTLRKPGLPQQHEARVLR
jgi:hypothetical protein